MGDILWAFRPMRACGAHGGPSRLRRVFGWGRAACSAILIGAPVAAAAATGADGLTTLLVALLTIAAALGALTARRRRHLHHLPLTGRAARTLPFTSGLALLAATWRLEGLTVRMATTALLALALGVGAGRLWRRPAGVATVRRTAVIAPESVADDLSFELGQRRHPAVNLVGRIETDPAEGAALAELVDRHDIELLLVHGESRVFDEIGATWADRNVAVIPVAHFYEESLGRAPLAALDSGWLGDLLNPTNRGAELLRRARDVAVASAVLAALGPGLLLLALLVRRDGGPALYRQARVGKGGRPFEILKLRTMRVADADGPRWSRADDQRVTPLGRYLRASHLDEIPQLINVVRGEMSLVGPRPEQVPIAAQLATEIPYYEWRHRVRPGITGWAQVIAGYCGTDRGAAVKTCYDLYYLKHRSLMLDACILVETLRTLVADRQWEQHELGVTFVPDPTQRLGRSLLRVTVPASPSTAERGEAPAPGPQACPSTADTGAGLVTSR